MSTNIHMEIGNGGWLSQNFLKENLQTLWVDGIIILDKEGKTDCEYSTDESLTNEITEYLQKEIIMDFAGYEERSYSERFTRKMVPILILQPAPEKMLRVLWQSTITHLLNLPEIIPDDTGAFKRL